MAAPGAASLVLLAVVAAVAPLALATERVIVVGSGFAGLAAAKELKTRGAEVVVLEARSRMGGRVYTDRGTGANMDMGASFIHGKSGNPITSLASSANAPLSGIVNYDNIITYDVDGTEDPISDATLERFGDLVNAASGVKVEQKSTESLQEVIDELQLAGKLSFFPNQRQLNYALNTIFEHEYAADASVLSSQQPYQGRSESGGDVVFPQGYDALIDYLATGLNVSLSTVVTDIRYSYLGVTVVTSKGTYAANKVIVTVPIGVLKAGDIKFHPELPMPKQRAISRIGSGTLNKVWLKFPSTFWDATKTIIGYLSEPKGHFCEFFNFPSIGDGKVLLGFNAGAYGEAIEAKTDAQIIAEVMSILRTIYGQSAPDPTAYRISRWQSDPYAKGSYSFLLAGGQQSDRVALSKNIMRKVFFAGEATNIDYPATTTGAYLSGVRAAREALDL